MRFFIGNRRVVLALVAAMPAAAAAQHWEALAGGIGSSAGGWGGPGMVSALGLLSAAEGSLVLVGGDFISPGYGFAAWNGDRWIGFGDGVPLPPCFDCGHLLRSISVFDDGSGQQVYIFGEFGWPPEVNTVLRSAGGPWEPLPESLPLSAMVSVGVDSLVFDDGAGESLFVAGRINGGSPALRGVARWDGAAWRPLGEGLRTSGGAAGDGVALAAAGGVLYVGGAFDRAGDVEASAVARWDGATWAPLGAGVDGWVQALAVWDDGAGEAIYAAGQFSAAGGAPASNIARWDGEAWAPLGEGLDGRVLALEVFDDGRGEALFAAGRFEQAGGTPARGLARWDGARWEDVGGSLVGEGWDLQSVERPPVGPALYVGGVFSSAGPVVTRSVARWVADRCRADLNGDGVLDFFDFLEFQALFAAGDLRADFTGDGVLDFFDFLAFQNEFAAGCP